MQPRIDGPFCVLPSKGEIGGMGEQRVLPLLTHDLVDRDDELMLARLLTRYPDWIERNELPRRNSHEVHKRTPEFKGSPKRHVVVGVGVGALPFVSKVFVWSYSILR